MDAGLHAKILELLSAHRILTLATIRPDGWPQATTVGYVSRGMTLWFMCGRASQKARNIASDNRVSLTIDRDVADPMAIAGLSMAARAFAVTDEAAIRRLLLEDMPKKYPEYRPMMDQVDITGLALFELRPEVISVLDYTKGFGHTDEVRLSEPDFA